MPRRAADLDEALKKKGGLTLSQLANYDDLLTDTLVDRVRHVLPGCNPFADDSVLGLLLVCDSQTETELSRVPRCARG